MVVEVARRARIDETMSAGLVGASSAARVKSSFGRRAAIKEWMETRTWWMVLGGDGGVLNERDEASVGGEGQRAETSRIQKNQNPVIHMKGARDMCL